MQRDQQREGRSRKKAEDVEYPRRGSAMSQVVIFHSCSANSSLADATSSGGRAGPKFQCSDVFTHCPLHCFKLGQLENRREVGCQGVWDNIPVSPSEPGHPSQAPSAPAGNDRSRSPSSQNPVPTTLSTSLGCLFLFS